MRFIVALFLIFALGCQTQQEHSVGGNKKIDRVRALYNSAEKLKLPLVWENTSNEYPTAREKHIKLSDGDTLIFGEEAALFTLLGVSKDTADFYTFLFSYPADDTRPLIVTIDKQGKLISQFLSGYSCGADCGFYCIGATFSLDKNLSFKSQHMSYSADCIENSNKVTMDTSKVTYTVLEKVGSISKNGKIKEKKDKVAEERAIPFSSKENPIEYFE
jgi:hypothetical protein